MNRAYWFPAFILAVVLVAAACGGEDSPEAGGAGVTPSAPATTPEAAKPDKLRIGFQAIPNGEILVKQQRWIEDQLGIDVEWTQFDSGRDVNTAIAAGSIDIGLVGSTPAAAGISRGLPYYVFWIYDVIGDNEALAVKRDAGISQVRDLVGKTVGVPFGSTTHYSLLQALKAEGVDPREVDIVDLQPPDLLAAWERGDIDAGYVWHPTLAKLLEEGGAVLVTSADLAKRGIVTADVAVVAKAFAEKYPESVVEYLRLQDRAIQQIRSDPQGSAQVIAPEFQIEADVALQQVRELIFLDAGEQLGADYLGTEARPGAFAKVLKETADFLVEQGVIESAPDLAAFEEGINTAWLEEASP